MTSRKVCARWARDARRRSPEADPPIVEPGPGDRDSRLPTERVFHESGSVLPHFAALGPRPGRLRLSPV
jgi:hypothetical protein